MRTILSPFLNFQLKCQVEGAELAEKYLAKAEALLVPFEEGRRRLAEGCLDPYTSVGRDVAQAAVEDRGARPPRRPRAGLWP